VTQQLLWVGVFLALLAALPWLLRWVRNRAAAAAGAGDTQSRFVSAVAVGPQQRVVTVEVGPAHERVWLTVGVTGQSMVLLHRSAPNADGQIASVSPNMPLSAEPPNSP
jgi:flagellar protein FliO/FliZ